MPVISPMLSIAAHNSLIAGVPFQGWMMFRGPDEGVQISHRRHPRQLTRVPGKASSVQNCDPAFIPRVDNEGNAIHRQEALAPQLAFRCASREHDHDGIQWFAKEDDVLPFGNSGYYDIRLPIIEADKLLTTIRLRSIVCT